VVKPGIGGIDSVNDSEIPFNVAIKLKNQESY